MISSNIFWSAEGIKRFTFYVLHVLLFDSDIEWWLKANIDKIHVRMQYDCCPMSSLSFLWCQNKDCTQNFFWSPKISFNESLIPDYIIYIELEISHW